MTIDTLPPRQERTTKKPAPFSPMEGDLDFGRVRTGDDCGLREASNRYRAFRSNPINFVDPMGLEAGATQPASAPTTTQATQPVNDFKIPHLDLIIMARPLPKEEMGYITQYINKHPETKYVDLSNKHVKQIAEAIINRSKELKKCVDVVIVSHGGHQYGPYIGPPFRPIDEMNPEAIVPFNEADMGPDVEYNKHLAGELKESDIYKVKGYVKNLYFTSCYVAQEAAGRQALDIIARELGLTIVIGRDAIRGVVAGGEFHLQPEKYIKERAKSLTEWLYITNGQ